MTAYENYQRLALIIRDKLTQEFGHDDDDVKRRWYEHNRVNEISTLDSRILQSYRQFIGSLFPNVMDFDKKMALDNKIIEELASRTDIDLYDRQVYLLALELNKELVVD